jgi:hypothetical protein
LRRDGQRWLGEGVTLLPIQIPPPVWVRLRVVQRSLVPKNLFCFI